MKKKRKGLTTGAAYRIMQSCPILLYIKQQQQLFVPNSEITKYNNKSAPSNIYVL